MQNESCILIFNVLKAIFNDAKVLENEGCRTDSVKYLEADLNPDPGRAWKQYYASLLYRDYDITYRNWGQNA